MQTGQPSLQNQIAITNIHTKKGGKSVQIKEKKTSRTHTSKRKETNQVKRQNQNDFQSLREIQRQSFDDNKIADSRAEGDEVGQRGKGEERKKKEIIVRRCQLLVENVFANMTKYLKKR